MRAFQTALKPSRILNILTVSLHSASIAVCLTWFYGRMMWFGLAALLASFIHSLRITNLKNRRAVTAVIIDRDGRAEIISGKEKQRRRRHFRAAVWLRLMPYSYNGTPVAKPSATASPPIWRTRNPTAG
ncbi:hypothetical protein NEILACOT_03588 [Neisseria lactamica ATCC 23970]|uniref:Uncharacterized protein n=1 Tax=Neisseria lactamica ATCC 23970 TaxID=546265 RepID=D0W7T8_NEILA|nr:hypothetical protein NEILACOT_03588 [Neisseria lactamica ATCC 23970]